jgi:hypothetical protein
MMSAKFQNIAAVVMTIILLAIAVAPVVAAPVYSAAEPGQTWHYVVMDAQGNVVKDANGNVEWKYCVNTSSDSAIGFSDNLASIDGANFSNAQLEAAKQAKCGFGTQDEATNYYKSLHPGQGNSQNDQGADQGSNNQSTNSGQTHGIQAGWPEQAAALDAMTLEQAQKWLSANVGGNEPSKWGKAGPGVWTYVDLDDEQVFTHPGHRTILTSWSGFPEAANARACWQQLPVKGGIWDGTTRTLQCVGSGATIKVDAVGFHLTGAVVDAGVKKNDPNAVSNTSQSGTTTGPTDLNTLFAAFMSWWQNQSNQPQQPAPQGANTTMTASQVVTLLVKSTTEAAKVACQWSDPKWDCATSDNSNVTVTIPANEAIAYWDGFDAPVNTADKNCLMNASGNPRKVTCQVAGATFVADKFAYYPNQTTGQ